MCGISCVYNVENSTEIIKEIIMEEEARGRDATGLAYLNLEDNKFYLFKKALSPKDYFDKYFDILKGRKEKIILGHNRQATTGLNKEADNEAHPFISEDKTFAIVHNGSILGYSYMQIFLEDIYSHKFDSTVDSECSIHLLEEALKKYKDRDQAIKFLSMFVSGTILVLFSDGELYIICDNSACYIVESNNSFYVASTFSALKPLVKGKKVNIYHHGKDFSSHFYKKGVWQSETNPTAIIKISDSKITSNLELKSYSLRLPISEGNVKLIRCDFCDVQEAQLCVEEKIDGTVYDKCMSCIEKEIQEPKYRRGTQAGTTSYHPHHPPIDEIPISPLFSRERREKTIIKEDKSEKINCSGYKHMVNFDRAIHCSLCSRYFCRGCFKDPRRHNCARFLKLKTGEEILSMNEWMYF